MKKLLVGKLVVAMAGMFAVGQVYALPSQVATYIYYNGTVAVGQSIRYCDGQANHWGSAPLATQSGAVSVVYSCNPAAAKQVIIPTSVDPWVRANFCITTGLCDVPTPGPIPGAGVLVPGFTSD